MKKKLIYFIFFIMLCFVINPCEYKAYRLDCEYKIDTNYNGKAHYLWLYFERENLSDEWKIRYNEKNEYDAWYQTLVEQGGSGSPSSLEGYAISGITALDTVCPSVAKFDMYNKKITLSNDIYILNTQKRVDKDPVHYECDYQNSIEGFRKTYNIHFKNDNGIYKFSNIYSWNSKTNKVDVANRSVDTQGLIYIERNKDDGSNLFKDLACPPIAYDDGKTVTLDNYEMFVLNSQFKESEKITCNYFRKTDVNKYFYNIEINRSILGEEYTITHLQEGGPALLQTTFTKNDLEFHGNECPITLKVKDDEISFSNVGYFYSTSSSQVSHCMEISNKNLCKAGAENYSCVWVEDLSLPNKGYCNINKLQFIACGDAFDIPSFIPNLVSLLINLLKIAGPIILIVVGIMALLKSLAASNEDEMKKAQKSLIRKIIASALVFFVISIVQFVIMKVADDGEAGNIDDCLTCLLNNDCKYTTYYKADVYGESICRYLNGEVFECPSGE